MEDERDKSYDYIYWLLLIPFSWAAAFAVYLLWQALRGMQ